MNGFRAKRFMGNDGRMKILCFNGRTYDLYNKDGYMLFGIKPDGFSPMYSDDRALYE